MNKALFEWEPPAWIPLDAWNEFVKMRKSKGARNKWTDLARDRAIEKLDAMRQKGVDLKEVLLTCAEFGWVGVEWGEAELGRRVAHSRREGMAGAPSRQFQALQALQGAKR